MKTLILLLIFNMPDGSSVEIAWKRDLAFAECDAMQRAIWNTPQEVAYYDDQGPVPAVDAACVYPAQLSAPE